MASISESKLAVGAASLTAMPIRIVGGSGAAVVVVVVVVCTGTTTG